LLSFTDDGKRNTARLSSGAVADSAMASVSAVSARTSAHNATVTVRDADTIDLTDGAAVSGSPGTSISR